MCYAAPKQADLQLLVRARQARRLAVSLPCLDAAHVSRRTHPCLSVSQPASLPVLVGHPRSPHCRRCTCGPTAMWENSVLLIQNPIFFAPELLCQSKMTPPNVDPIGLDRTWSSFLSLRMVDKQVVCIRPKKRIRSRQKLACHARTFSFLPDLLSSLSQGRQRKPLYIMQEAQTEATELPRDMTVCLSAQAVVTLARPRNHSAVQQRHNMQRDGAT